MSCALLFCPTPYIVYLNSFSDTKESKGYFGMDRSNSPKRSKSPSNNFFQRERSKSPINNSFQRERSKSPANSSLFQRDRSKSPKGGSNLFQRDRSKSPKRSSLFQRGRSKSPDMMDELSRNPLFNESKIRSQSPTIGK